MGHREVLKNLVAIARQSGTRSVLVTFTPHPLQILHPEKSPKSILLQEDKIERIGEMGIDYLLNLKFDLTFSEMSGESFIREDPRRGIACQVHIGRPKFRFRAQTIRQRRIACNA